MCHNIKVNFTRGKCTIEVDPEKEGHLGMSAILPGALRIDAELYKFVPDGGTARWWLSEVLSIPTLCVLSLFPVDPEDLHDPVRMAAATFVEQDAKRMGDFVEFACQGTVKIVTNKTETPT